MKRRLTQPDVDRIRDEYLSWEKNKFAMGHETIEQFCRRLGTSRSRLYELRKNEWTLTGQRAQSNGHSDDSLAPAVRFLTEELLVARARIDELEAQIKTMQSRRRTGQSSL